ncbi:MAG: hypothetical protein R3C05_08275 [Pirellulaceae bacterium]
MLFQENPEGHLVVTIPSLIAADDRDGFFAKRQQLEDEFWTKLDEIVSGEQRASLHALGRPLAATATAMTPGIGHWKDGARSRPKAYPRRSSAGTKTGIPATVEIWKKGTWFHYKVRANGNQLAPATRKNCPTCWNTIFSTQSRIASPPSPYFGEPKLIASPPSPYFFGEPNLTNGEAASQLFKSNSEQLPTISIDAEVLPSGDLRIEVFEVLGQATLLRKWVHILYPVFEPLAEAAEKPTSRCCFISRIRSKDGRSFSGR